MNNRFYAYDFIRHLEVSATNAFFPLNDLYRVVQYFVTGTAKKWLWSFYRTTKYHSWLELRLAFLERFSYHDSELANKRFIERRE